MSAQIFDEWFAIRPDHNDEEHWTGRLYFDRHEGIRVKTTRFINTSGRPINSAITNKTMTGWLDFQRPTTLINPWIQSVGGFSAGVNTLGVREKYTIVADAILKNIFLNDLSEPIFSGVYVDHPAIHAWIQPNLVRYNWAQPDAGTAPSISVEVKPSRERTFRLDDGTTAILYSATRSPSSDSDRLEDYTTLDLRFSQPICYDQIMRLVWRISSTFEFVIGRRVPEPDFQLYTTHTRKWNDEDCEIVAELLYVSSPQRNGRPQVSNSNLTTEIDVSLSLKKLIEMLGSGNDELIYLANLLQSADEHETPFVQTFGELIGCLEDFDTQHFGSGADPSFKETLEQLGQTVSKNGTSDEIKLFNRLRGGARNSFSLLKRLERLQSSWQDDGFRGSPKLSRIRDLRNLIPHGKGLQLTDKDAREIAVYLDYLKALGRYHVMKKMGFSVLDIGRSFLRQPHRFAMFAPISLQHYSLQGSGS